MNWVGGVRKRVKYQNEKKAQKEFFERKKLLVPNTSRLKSMSTPHLKKHSVSQDLLALQTISHAHSNAKTDPAKRPVRKLDLEGFRSTVTGKKYKEVELPTSPFETPSMLDLIEKDLFLSKYTRSKSDYTVHQNNKVSQSQLGFNSRSVFSNLLSPRRNRDLLAESSALSLTEHPFQNTCNIIPDKSCFTPRKDSAKSQDSNNCFGPKPFLRENSEITGNIPTSSFTAPFYTRSELKVKSKNPNPDQENIPPTCYSKHDYNPNRILDERLHNLWVSEDFQTTPLIKYNSDKFQEEHFKLSNYPTYKSNDSKPLIDDQWNSQFHKSFDDEVLMYDTPVKFHSQDKNRYIKHDKIDLPMEETQIYKYPNKDIKTEDLSLSRDDDKNRSFLTELTPFYRAPNNYFHTEKQRKIAYTPELNNSKHLQKTNPFDMYISRNLENDYSYSDSEYVWKKRKHLKSTSEVGKTNVCKNPHENLPDVQKCESFDNVCKNPHENLPDVHKCESFDNVCKHPHENLPGVQKRESFDNVCKNPHENLPGVQKRESFDNVLQPLKVRYNESVWNLSEQKVPEKYMYYDKNREEIASIPLQPSEKIQETNSNHLAEDISAPVEYSSLSSTKYWNTPSLVPGGESVKDESEDENCVAICTKEEYEQYWRSKCSPVDAVLNELIQLDNEDEDVKNTSFSCKTSTVEATRSENKNTLTDMDLIDSLEDKLDDQECVVEVIETLVRKVVMQENTVELSNSILSNRAWAKPNQSKKSLDVITLVFRENHIMEQNASIGEQLADHSANLSGFSKNKNVFENGSVILKCHSLEQKQKNDSKLNEEDFKTLLKNEGETLTSSPVKICVKHELVDASTSPVLTTVDVGVQWETPESSQEEFVSVESQPDYISATMDDDAIVQSCDMSMELCCEQWVVHDKCLDSQTQPKEQAYTLRPRKK